MDTVRMNLYGGSDFMFSFVPIMFFFILILMAVVLIYSIGQKAKQNSRNNNSPVLTVEATVSSKRTDVSTYHHSNAAVNSMDSYSSSTKYYATFQVESGDRIELEITGTEYGLLAEGDGGKLTFQGTRYLGYVRK